MSYLKTASRHECKQNTSSFLLFTTVRNGFQSMSRTGLANTRTNWKPVLKHKKEVVIVVGALTRAHTRTR